MNLQAKINAQRLIKAEQLEQFAREHEQFGNMQHADHYRAEARQIRELIAEEA